MRVFARGYYPSKKPAGFTVIEMVLGLGIFAVMAASVFLIYTNAVRIDRESRRLSDLSMESYWTLSSIAEDLESSVAYRYGSEGEDRPVFDGNGDSLRILVEGERSLQWVSYGLADQADGTVRKTILGRRSTRNVDQVLSEHSTEGALEVLTRVTSDFKGRPLTDKDPVAAEILTSRIDAGGLKFLYGVNGSDGLSWKTEWHKPEPPAAVRVIVRLTDQSSRNVLEVSRDILVSSARQE
jgi:type II secretory pathway component PulJ